MKAQIYNFTDWIDETDPETIKRRFDWLLVSSGFGVLSFSEHYFKPYGYSSLYLLSESHLAIHTFPEEGQTYIELSSCVNKPYRRFLSLYVKNSEVFNG